MSAALDSASYACSAHAHGVMWMVCNLKKFTLFAIFISLLTISALFGCGLYYMSHPMERITIESRNQGGYIIGASKTEVINSAMREQAFSPQPKSDECQENWIRVSLIGENEKNCLLSSNEWIVEQVEYNDFRPLCKKEKVDLTVKLLFSDDKLSKLVIECWMPK